MERPLRRLLPLLYALLALPPLLRAPV